MSIAAVLADFQASCAVARSLIAVAHQQDVTGAYTVGTAEQELITEAALLRLFIAWETFLEKSIKEYMQGAASIAGNNVTRYVSPVDENHANRLIIGTMTYFEYSKPEKVVKLCRNVFFQGEPYTSSLSALNQTLEEIKTIRNATAHMSSTTTDALKALARRKLGVASRVSTVYGLILSPHPSTPTMTVFDDYVAQLDTAAHTIAHF